MPPIADAEIEIAAWKTTDAGARPYLDLAALDAAVLGDGALARELLELFLRRSLIWTDAIRAGAARRRQSDAAHSMKGAALALGARRLADLARRVEEAPVDAVETDWLAALSALQAGLDQTRAAIEAILAGGALDHSASSRHRA